MLSLGLAKCSVWQTIQLGKVNHYTYSDAHNREHRDTVQTSQDSLHCVAVYSLVPVHLRCCKFFEQLINQAILVDQPLVTVGNHQAVFWTKSFGRRQHVVSRSLRPARSRPVLPSSSMLPVDTAGGSHIADKRLAKGKNFF